MLYPNEQEDQSMNESGTRKIKGTVLTAGS